MFGYTTKEPCPNLNCCNGQIPVYTWQPLLTSWRTCDTCQGKGYVFRDYLGSLLPPAVNPFDPIVEMTDTPQFPEYKLGYGYDIPTAKVTNVPQIPNYKLGYGYN